MNKVSSNIKRLIVLIILSLSIAINVHSQRAHRGAKALSDGNFDKSIGLFEKALSKDSNDVMALIGFAKAHFQESGKTKTIIQLDLLKDCYNYLKKAKAILPKDNPELQKLLWNDLNISGTTSVDELLKINTDYIWNGFINQETAISNYEYFLANYYIATNTNSKEKVLSRLDDLYFDSLKKVNTIPAYEFYIKKFENASPNGKSLVLAHKFINILEYNDAFAAAGIVKLKAFIDRNKNKKFNGEASIENVKNTKLASKEIEKREFNRALADPSIGLLEQFVIDYKQADQVKEAKDTIENREYKFAMTNHVVVAFDKFLSKYPKSTYKNEIEDSVAFMLFRSTIISNDRIDLVNYLTKINNYHKGNTIKLIEDSTNSKIYNIDYQEAQTTKDLSKLIKFYKKYKSSPYPNVSVIKIKLFTMWEEAITKYSYIPEVNDLIDFINEFDAVPVSSFNKVIEATKIRIAKNTEAIKQELIKNIINESTEGNIFYSKLDNYKKLNLIKIIANKLNIKNSSTNTEIFNNLKKYNLENIPSLLDYFAAFHENFTINNAYVETSLPSSDLAFQISYTSNGVVSKLVLWDSNSRSYKEVEEFNTNNATCKTIKTNYGVVAFSTPFISAAYSNVYSIRFYGFKSTDSYCCPSYEIELICNFINNQLEPAAAPTIRNTGGNANSTPQLTNYLNIGSNINRALLVNLTSNNFNN